jgi:hypothetical protein
MAQQRSVAVPARSDDEQLAGREERIRDLAELILAVDELVTVQATTDLQWTLGPSRRVPLNSVLIQSCITQKSIMQTYITQLWLASGPGRRHSDPDRLSTTCDASSPPTSDPFIVGPGHPRTADRDIV